MSVRMEQGMSHFSETIAKILREVVEFPPGVLVTVNRSQLTRNLAHAKVVLSVLPLEKEQVAYQTLKDYDREIKDALAHELAMRKLPKLFWSFDKTEAIASDVERILNELKAKGEL